MRFLSTFSSVGGVTDANADVVPTDIAPTAARVPASTAIRMVLRDMRGASYLVLDLESENPNLARMGVYRTASGGASVHGHPALWVEGCSDPQAGDRRGVRPDGCMTWRDQANASRPRAWQTDAPAPFLVIEKPRGAVSVWSLGRERFRVEAAHEGAEVEGFEGGAGESGRARRRRLSRL